MSVTASISFSTTQVVLTAVVIGISPAPANHAFIKKKNVNSVADVMMSLDSYDPLTDHTFTTTRTIDGWYEGTVITITKWTAGSYVNGDTLDYNGVIYKANTSTSSTPGSDGTWTIVTDLTTVVAGTYVIITVASGATPINADVYWSKVMAAYAQLGQDEIFPDDRLLTRYDTMLRNIQSVYALSSAGLYDDAEWVVLRLQNTGAR